MALVGEQRLVQSASLLLLPDDVPLFYKESLHKVLDEQYLIL